MAMPAFAQTSSPSSPPARSTSPSGAPATPRATLPSDIGSMKVSELVGKNVYTANDEKIGDVNDVVTSKSGGKGMAVIGVGGFLGIGEKEAAVSLDQLKVQGDKLVLAGATKDSLKQQATDYKKDEYTKVDRDKMVSQAGGMSTPSGSTAPSTSGSSSTGSSGSSTMGSGSSTPSTGGSSSGSSGMSGSGTSTGSGSSSGSSTTGGSTGAAPSSPSGSSTMGGSSGGSAPAGNAPSGGGATQTPKQ
jgi:sporulation protein YlmC with PRC-barrel domain